MGLTVQPRDGSRISSVELARHCDWTVLTHLPEYGSEFRTTMFKWVCADTPHVATSFDLFGTLVDAERLSDPAAVVATELSDRGVAVPDDWGRVYSEPHVDVPAGAEVSLVDHVRAALASCGVTVPEARVRRAVLAAFETPVTLRPGAEAALDAATDHGPVGLLSNCSVPGLVGRTLDATTLDDETFDAVVASVDCGWRKPDPRAFETLASELDVPIADLVHVGDDPATDGGISDAGGAAVLLDETPLSDVPAEFERRERA
jgi:FMN phosphatase YigB (HAD superfamily)